MTKYRILFVSTNLQLGFHDQTSYINFSLNTLKKEFWEKKTFWFLSFKTSVWQKIKKRLKVKEKTWLTENKWRRKASSDQSNHPSQSAKKKKNLDYKLRHVEICVMVK